MSVKYAILGLLNITPMTGYIIKKNMELSIKKFWPMSYGGLYPQLHKLNDEGLIESKEVIKDGRTNIKYSITELGKKELHAWLLIQSNQVQCKDEYILKIFLSQDLDQEQRKILIKDYLRFKEEQFRDYEALLKIEDHQRYYIDEQTRFVLEYTYYTLKKEIELIEAFLEKH
jgi:PadR family transcriptional regulator, regulatory protein AphA